MTFEEAVRKSIIAYFNGEDPTELMNASEGEIKYTREYMDEVEKELLGKDAPQEDIVTEEMPEDA